MANVALDKKAIIEWMQIFKRLYEKADIKRSPVEMWVAATAHFSAMGEAIRRMDFADLMYSASHAFCWMCSFVLACHREKDTVFSLTESFSEIVASKYPLVCGHCQDTHCHCNPKLMDTKANKAVLYKELLNKRKRIAKALNNYSVSDWISIFDEIYGQHIHMLTLESIGFHFLEEAGEELTALRGLKQLESVADAGLTGVDKALLGKLASFEGVVELFDAYVNKKPEPQKSDPEAIKARLVHAKVDMFIEFADTFSWFCSILNKVMSIAGNCKDYKCPFAQNAFQSKILEQYLPDGSPQCPSCLKCPCECVFYNY